jgi:peptide deformylase
MLTDSLLRTKQEYLTLRRSAVNLTRAAAAHIWLAKGEMMAIHEIIQLPDPLLREVSKPVERIGPELLALLDDMAETMYDAPGIGLAGIQIGVPLRVITIDCEKRAEDEAEGDGKPQRGETAVENRNPMFLINPRIVTLADNAAVYEEGCLSIPDYYAEVERPAGCAVAYLDRDGRERTIQATGLLSTCLQHEIDHLDGKLFIDLLSRLKRDMVVRKFTKIAKQNGKPAGRMVG